MDPMTLAAIGGGVSMAAQMVGGANQNAANAQIADKNRSFQAEMSNTAHQREVSDLKSAGLNPLLSASGAGASTPAGAGANMENVEGSAISKGIETAIGLKRASQESDLNDANISNIHAINSVNMQEAALKANQTAAAQEEVKTKNYQNEILKRTKENVIRESNLKNKWEPAAAFIRAFAPGVNSAVGAAGLGK